jgi:hypothetical protein
VNEKFNFTPSATEILSALRAVRRSINRDTVGPVLQFLTCVGVYGLPLAFAGFFFRRSFEEIYFTFFLFVVAAMVLPRLVRGAPAAIAERYSVTTEVRLDSDNLRQITPTTETSWSWAHLSRLHVLDWVVVLEFRDWSWVSLPNHLWADEAHKAGFLGELRGHAPNLLPDPPSSVPSPFTLINVGAGFGVMDAYLALLTVLARTARSECGCSVSWHIAGKTVAFGLLNAAIIAISFAAFFPIRHALRAINRKQRLAAAIIAHLFIWPVPIALIIFAIVR